MTAEATLKTWGPMWSPARPADRAGSADAARRMDGDGLLVGRCLRGDSGAWEELVRSHTRLVYGTCYRFTGTAEDSRDLTQDVFLRVFRNLASFDLRSGSFRTWLIRLTRNLLIDHYRKNRKHRVLDSIEDQTSGLEASAEMGGRADRALAGREAGEALGKGLSRLSPDLREAVILRDLQEMEYREISEVLGVPEGTVKSRLNRGRRELAKQLRAMGVRP